MANNNTNTIDHHPQPIDRDERHPLMDPAIAGIDNNTLNNIINSIIKSNKINETHFNQTDGSTQYLLPVDLLVSIDNKSNIPTVQAALPSSFAIQQSSFTTPITPITPITTTIPNMSFPNYNTPPIINKSSLNPSAPSFTPYTPYTPIQPILEAENDNKNSDNDIKDEWCIYDDIEQQTQQQNNTIKKEIVTPNNKNMEPFKPKQRFYNNNNQDKRQYDKSWRNHSNNHNTNTMPMRWRNNRFGNNNKVIKLLAEFVRHVTLPNRHKYPPNTLLTKTWAMRNCGETEWGYNVELVYCKGDEKLSLHNRYAVNNVQCGQEIEISANIKTPLQSGRYCTYFRLQKNGKFFGPRVWVDIIVASLDQIDNANIINNCGKQINNENNNNNNNKVLPQKAIKWKKKYGTKNEAHNHYKIVSCK